MNRVVLTTASALLIFGASAAVPQTAAPKIQQGHMTAADWNALRDARISVLKGALQLRPDQMQLWPPLEAAIRARSELRQKRLTDLEARLSSDDALKTDPVRFLKTRAEMLGQRADSLRKLADGWQPLYVSLDEDQKRRMRILGGVMLHEMRQALANGQSEDEDDDDELDF